MKQKIQLKTREKIFLVATLRELKGGKNKNGRKQAK